MQKKLGLGSWMSYVDKFGIPPVFAITDRMDTARRDELFEMLSNFRQNMFAVLQGAERIEVPRISESNPHNVFLSLIDDVCNKEISKRVLGGTATTDEKSFVGSAEVQERVANDQHEADKLLFKHLFNTKIRRRLTKISSVYKAFDTHSLVWDNQETLNINGYIDAVQKLSAAFEFDVDEVRARTGLPVTGAGQLTDPFAVPEPTPEPKPKPDSGKTQKKNLTPSSLSTLNSQLSTLNSQLSTQPSMPQPGTKPPNGSQGGFGKAEQTLPNSTGTWR